MALDSILNSYLLRTTSIPMTAAPLTISGWCYWDTGDSTYVCTLGTSSPFQLHIYPSAGQVLARATYGGYAIASANCTSGAWNHVAARYVSNVDRSAFLNGGNRGDSTTNLTPSVSTNLEVFGYGGGNDNIVTTRLDHVAIWNVALSNAEVAQLYTHAPPLVRPDALVAYYRFDNNGMINDRWGGYHMTQQGATPTFVAGPGNLILPGGPRIVAKNPAAAVGQPASLRGTHVPYLRQWTKHARI